MGQPWLVGLLGLVRGCRFFLDGDGCIQRGRHLQEYCFLSAVPASEERLASLSEFAIRGADKLPSLVAPWRAREPEGEAPCVVQLRSRRCESGF